ncbi:MAG: cysteinyl-tRNA synthetase [Acidobacteria bacterium]|nr:cysteinyl-tRNA synthetase [Acidobacteriota bacterium]
MSSGVLALLGSGETGPGMTKVHRGLLARLADPRAVNLNTPYGFQENVAQMTEKLLTYFSTSLHLDVTGLDLRRYDAASDEQRQGFKDAIRRANYVFAGPGSPSYALRQWLPMHLTDDLASVLAHDGVVCFSSAAALTLGRFTPPVYEIYKSGNELEWLTGLDLMTVVGLDCVVLPHYNNAEGRDYDTSRCYIGERRLRLLEESLPPDIGVLGIDEHTAAVIDLATSTLTVKGKGEAHWRREGRVSDFANASVVPLADLGARARVLAPGADLAPPMTNVVDEAEVLALREAQGRLVDALNAIRATARAQGHYDIADDIRDALSASGVVVRDAAVSPR